MPDSNAGAFARYAANLRAFAERHRITGHVLAAAVRADQASAAFAAGHEQAALKAVTDYVAIVTSDRALLMIAGCPQKRADLLTTPL